MAGSFLCRSKELTGRFKLLLLVPPPPIYYHIPIGKSYQTSNSAVPPPSLSRPLPLPPSPYTSLALLPQLESFMHRGGRLALAKLLSMLSPIVYRFHAHASFGGVRTAYVAATAVVATAAATITEVLSISFSSYFSFSISPVPFIFLSLFRSRPVSFVFCLFSFFPFYVAFTI